MLWESVEYTSLCIVIRLRRPDHSAVRNGNSPNPLCDELNSAASFDPRLFKPYSFEPNYLIIFHLTPVT